MDAHADRAVAPFTLGKLEKLGYVDGNVVPLAARADQFLLAVAGGESGHHALYFCTFGLTWSVTKPFVLGAEWTGGEACDLPDTPSKTRT